MADHYLVLGLGNELFTDEGVGIAAARRLEERGLPGVDVLDGGTLGIALLPAIEDRPGLVVLDALATTAAPGTVVVLDADEIEQHYRMVVSAHQIGLPEVLAAAELDGRAPARLAAVGMVPDSLDTGFGISPVAEAALDTMVDRAVDIIHEWEATDHA